MENKKRVPAYELEDLNKLFDEANECDKRMFSEYRTNLQLVAGMHYLREGTRFWNRVRSSRDLTDRQKLRITKNHIQRVTKIYRNMIESIAPGVTFQAQNEKEMKDQKAAQLHESYWLYNCDKNNFDELRSTWIKNFVEIGEVWVKIFWDENGGSIVGYEPAVEMIDGQQVMKVDPMTGEPIQDKSKPVYGGQLKYETLEAYSVRRDPGARSINDSPFIFLEKSLSPHKLRPFINSAEQFEKLD